MPTEFEVWIKEVESFLGYELTIPEFVSYMNMYYEIKYSGEI